MTLTKNLSLHLIMNQMLDNFLLAQIKFCELNLLFEGLFRVNHKDVPLVGLEKHLILQEKEKKKTVEFTAYMVRTENLEGRTSCRNVDNLIWL
jgi:hypothetical protein